ncbi:hypothetical protein SK128_020469 [Halocaridina rubra]|uniref:Ras-associating domain-containing protein n=1 Tax=Halocaridina rubra TaxID=373956 RepID=A0AAN9AA81_HALRR
MARPSCSSLKIRSDPPPPKIIRTQDDSDVPYENTQNREYFYSSPEFLRKNLSSPDSSISDSGSPEVSRANKSGRSKSLQSSPVINRKLMDVPEDAESVTCSQDLLNVPVAFQTHSNGQESDDDPHSSPEISKKDLSSRPSTLPRRGLSRTSGELNLKGQSIRKSLRSADTCSVSSTCSFSSLGTNKLSSRASSTSSLADQTVIPVKVYLRFMRPDIEYKTMRLSTATTCRQLIALLLAKFRLRHRDPNLFFVRMEITVRTPEVGAPTRRLLVLDDQARPAELQQCRPRGDARFSVGVRRGGLLRIHDSILMPGSQYKSLLVSYRTTAEELVQLLLYCYNRNESPRHYAVHEVNKCPYSDRPLRHDEYPLLVQSEWPRPDRQNYSFVLRRNVNYALSLKARISWRRSLDQSSTDTESDHEDHLTTRKLRAPSLPVTQTPYKSFSNQIPESCSNSPKIALGSSTSLSPAMSRVSCDSGFSSPSSSSRSSTASTGSPSPPASPSPSVNSGCTMVSKSETGLCKPSVSVSRSLSPRESVTSSCSTSLVTISVGSSTASSVNESKDANNQSTPVHATIVSTQDENTPSPSASVPSVLTIPISPISVPFSPPPLSVLSSSVVITSLSPAASTPVATDSILAKRSQFLPLSYISFSDSGYTTIISSSEPPSSLDIEIGGTVIPPSSAPLSPSSPTLSRKRMVPPSPSAPTSPTKQPPSLQSTIITIPTSGPSVVSSNTLSPTSPGMKELTAALESLRTLTIRCPNYDSCFYI